MSEPSTLIYILRRDLRVADNPILNHLSTQKGEHNFTNVLPLYVFSAQQIEVSGFIQDPETKSPYPEARSKIGNIWRCGPHRAKFLAETVDDLKSTLEKVGSGLCIRVGMLGEVVKDLLEKLAAKNVKVSAVWMAGEEGFEEGQEEKEVKTLCEEVEVDFKLWVDEKYLIDDRDLPFDDIKDFPDVFTTYRKMVEPLRDQPRDVLPAPAKDSLPAFPAEIPAQHKPFTMPNNLHDIIGNLLKPLKIGDLVKDPPIFPTETESAHPFTGGESYAKSRLQHLVNSGSITAYHNTRNGLMGLDYSTKLSAYLALGAITARQIHAALLSLENGSDPAYESVPGYGKGENDGTKAIRFELLWRDYMRLCARKFGTKLFRISGFKGSAQTWTSPTAPPDGEMATTIDQKVTRVFNGTTGMGLIDASMRELYLTGYTSNRARQNVASFFAKMLKLDWRLGAEWFESLLIDYDLSSNWGNWQYLAGVGNDPRGEARVFNPVKQAFEYDPEGKFVKAWMPEMRKEGLELGEVFQGWTIKESKREELGLKGLIGVEDPLLKVDFTVGRRGGRYRGPRGGDQGNSRGGGDRGGRGGAGGRWGGRGGGYRGNYAGRGYGSTGRGWYGGSGAGAGAGFDPRSYVQRAGPNGRYMMEMRAQMEGGWQGQRPPVTQP